MFLFPTPFLARGGLTSLRPQDVFKIDKFAGNGASNFRNSGIDFTTHGGAVFGKSLTTSNTSIIDTVRGRSVFSNINNNGAEQSFDGPTYGVTSFGSSGLTFGAAQANYMLNDSSAGYDTVAYHLRRASKFFDVVTYTGNGSSGRTISHNLSVAPGLILIVSLSVGRNVVAYHRSAGATKFLTFNSNAIPGTSSLYWADTEPTDTVFTLGSDANVNNSGSTYVAYLFAHDGDVGGLIRCGTHSAGGGSDVTIDTDWKPQFVMYRPLNALGYWRVFDNVRGYWQFSYSPILRVAEFAAEGDVSTAYPEIVGGGWKIKSPPTTQTGIYVAIRENV